MESGGTIRRFSGVFRWSSALALLAVCAAACRKSSPSRYDPPVEVKADPSASAPPPPKKEFDLATLGFADRPNEPSKEANDAVHDGLQKHKAKKWADARALFEKAVAASPDYALARFDLACAASRLGDVETAKSEMEKLLLLDFAAFDPRLENDEDLDALRASPQGDALRDRAEAIRAAWLRAAEQGVPAVMWRERTGQTSYTGAKEALWLRVGVWIPSTRRFLALAPDVVASNGWYDREAHKVNVFTAFINRCELDFCPNLISGSATIFDPLATKPSTAAKYAATVRMYDAQFAVLDGAVRARFNDCDVHFAGPCDTGWMRMDGKDFRYDASTLPPPRMQIDSDSWGSMMSVMPADWSLDAKTAALRHASGKTIALDKLHAEGTSMMILDGDRALVATSRNQCDCEHFPEGDRSLHEHVVSIVDVPAATARVWRKGPGVAFVAMDARGGVYLQVDDEVEHWTSSSKIETDTPETLAAGMLLGAPAGAPNYCCSL